MHLRLRNREGKSLLRPLQPLVLIALVVTEVGGVGVSLLRFKAAGAFIHCSLRFLRFVCALCVLSLRSLRFVFAFRVLYLRSAFCVCVLRSSQPHFSTPRGWLTTPLPKSIVGAWTGISAPT